MATYSCKYCGYKSTKERKPEKCGYCSKAGAMEEVESAERLLEEL